MRSMRHFYRAFAAPRDFGLSAERDTAGRFCVRRGEGAPVSLDDDLSNIARRIESLRRRKVGLQLIGPPPGFASWPGGAASVEYARTLNEHGAQVVAQGQGHLELMVTLPLGEPESCAYELERALDLYGARSALLPATAGGRPLDTGTFDRYVQPSRKMRDIAVPASGIGRATIAISGLRIATRRAMAGRDFIRRCTDDLRRVLRALSAAKILLAHGGGAVLFLKDIRPTRPGAPRAIPISQARSRSRPATISASSISTLARNHPSWSSSRSGSRAPIGSCSELTIRSKLAIPRAGGRFRPLKACRRASGKRYFMTTPRRSWTRYTPRRNRPRDEERGGAVSLPVLVGRTVAVSGAAAGDAGPRALRCRTIHGRNWRPSARSVRQIAALPR